MKYTILKNYEPVDKARTMSDALIVQDTLREFYPMSEITVEEAE